MNDYRLLITGSRDWVDADVIRSELAEFWRSVQPGRVILVSGHASSGADALAEKEWSMRDLPIEAHPADWHRDGRRAGILRNEQMVDLGADRCLAFIMRCTSSRCERSGVHGSHGASHCASAAEKAGIPVKVIKSGW